MKTRATLALAAAAGLASMASAQEQFVISYSWREVNVGTNVLVGAPNSILDPGEGARITLAINAQIGGTNAVGQVVNLTAPISGFSSGTVRGIGSFVYDIVGNAGAATASGAWNNLLGGTNPFTQGSSGGTLQSGGAIIQGFGGSQGAAPGSTANGVNPVSQAWRGVWNPSNYATRTVNFLGRGSVAVPVGQQNGLLVAYNVNTSVDPQDPTTWFDDYVGKYIGSNFGQGLNIPVAPAPSSVALLGLGALIAGRRRR